MRGRINVNNDNVTLSAIIDHRQQLLNAKRIIIVACGTSWHAGLIGKQLLETFCRIPVNVEYASEFRYRNPVVSADDVVIALSQSGETADTLAAIELAKNMVHLSMEYVMLSVQVFHEQHIQVLIFM